MITRNTEDCGDCGRVTEFWDVDQALGLAADPVERAQLEELVSDPEATMVRVCEWCEVVDPSAWI